MPRPAKPIGPAVARVIQLDRLEAAHGFPAYVAIYSEQAPVSPFALSPTLMQWSDCIWLCRLQDCEQFWRAQQHKLDCELDQLFEPILRYHYGASFIAVFANHPWPGLVYLAFQLQQRAQGVYFLHSLLNRNIYKTLGWHCWFAPQQALAEHWQSLGVKRFNPQRLGARQAQLKRFIARVGLAGPFDLRAVDAAALTRRFDSWLGKVWRWGLDSGPQLQDFPWIALAPGQRPRVSRDLEYPVNQWASIELLLREDFARLCEQFDFDEHEHINLMRWEITLFNYQLVEVELSFRHPYSLHREAPTFDTALYQAWYVYDDLIRKLQRRDRDLDLPETMPFISWRVEVCERLHLPPVLWDLFAFEQRELSAQGLGELQNKLTVPIEAYRCAANFYPQQSFQGGAMGAVAEPPFDDYQWASCSAYRPLFYYADAQPIDTPACAPLRFLERGASQWWQHDDAERQQQDYYLLKDERGRASWVYRDGDGNWFKQGEYS